VGKIAPNLLERNFEAARPNQKWVTDYNRPVLNMVKEMLDKAFETIPDGTNLILHSDQGWHYQHKRYQRMIKEKGILESMSRRGNCVDNAVMENFFGLLKSELLYLQKFDSVEHFMAELIDDLGYYNNRRIKAKLKGLPPAIHRPQALLAAS
jgi:putative transposase